VRSSSWACWGFAFTATTNSSGDEDDSSLTFDAADEAACIGGAAEDADADAAAAPILSDGSSEEAASARATHAARSAIESFASSPRDMMIDDSLILSLSKQPKGMSVRETS
jgi:hypothetical protein